MFKVHVIFQLVCLLHLYMEVFFSLQISNFWIFVDVYSFNTLGCLWKRWDSIPSWWNHWNIVKRLSLCNTSLCPGNFSCAVLFWEFESNLCCIMLCVLQQYLYCLKNCHYVWLFFITWCNIWKSKCETGAMNVEVQLWFFFYVV